MPKVHQNTFDGRTRWRSLCAPPDPLAAIGGLLLRRGRKGEEATFKGGRKGRKGGERDGE